MEAATGDAGGEDAADEAGEAAVVVVAVLERSLPWEAMRRDAVYSRG